MLTTPCYDLSLQRFCWQLRVAALHICTKRCLLAINPPCSPECLSSHTSQMAVRAAGEGNYPGRLFPASHRAPALPAANEEGEAETARALLMIWDKHQKAQTIKSLELLLHACRCNLLQLSPSFHFSPSSPSGKRKKLFLSRTEKPAMPPPRKTCQIPGSESSELLLFF